MAFDGRMDRFIRRSYPWATLLAVTCGVSALASDAWFLKAYGIVVINVIPFMTMRLLRMQLASERRAKRHRDEVQRLILDDRERCGVQRAWIEARIAEARKIAGQGEDWKS